MKEIILENNNLDLKNGDFYVFNLIKKNNTYIVEKVLLKDNKIKITKNKCPSGDKFNDMADKLAKEALGSS